MILSCKVSEFRATIAPKQDKNSCQRSCRRVSAPWRGGPRSVSSECEGYLGLYAGVVGSSQAVGLTPSVEVFDAHLQVAGEAVEAVGCQIHAVAVVGVACRHHLLAVGVGHRRVLECRVRLDVPDTGV